MQTIRASMRGFSLLNRAIPWTIVKRGMITANNPIDENKTLVKFNSLLSTIKSLSIHSHNDSNNAKIPIPMKKFPREMFFDEFLFTMEINSFFKKQFLFAGISDSLPSIGSHFTLELGDSSVIIIRGRDMKIRALFNNCSHMNARLCQWSRKIKVTDKIQCPLHHWQFELNGEHRAPITPLTKSPAQKKHFALGQASLIQENGMIFVRMMRENNNDLNSSINELPNEILDHLPQGVDLANFRLFKTKNSLIEANWKLLEENLNDEAGNSYWSSIKWKVNNNSKSIIIDQKWPVNATLSAITRYQLIHSSINESLESDVLIEAKEFFNVEDLSLKDLIIRTELLQKSAENGLNFSLNSSYFSSLLSGLRAEIDREEECLAKNEKSKNSQIQ